MEGELIILQLFDSPLQILELHPPHLNLYARTMGRKIRLQLEGCRGKVAGFGLKVAREYVPMLGRSCACALALRRRLTIRIPRPEIRYKRAGLSNQLSAGIQPGVPIFACAKPADG
jgi:hypothetical protein